MGTEIELARFVTNTRYQDLAEEVIKASKRDIPDTTGVGLGGASAPGIGVIGALAVQTLILANPVASEGISFLFLPDKQEGTDWAVLNPLHVAGINRKTIVSDDWLTFQLRNGTIYSERFVLHRIAVRPI